MYLNLASLQLLHFLKVTGSVLFLQSHVTMMIPFLIIIIVVILILFNSIYDFLLYLFLIQYFTPVYTLNHNSLAWTCLQICKLYPHPPPKCLTSVSCPNTCHAHGGIFCGCSPQNSPRCSLQPHGGRRKIFLPSSPVPGYAAGILQGGCLMLPMAVNPRDVPEL